MKYTIFIISVITILCSIAAGNGDTNRIMEKAGKFNGNWVGDWEHAVDGEGALEAGAYRAAYTDNNNNKEVVKSNSYVMSFSDNPLFTGTYWVSASVWLQGYGTNAHPGTFQGGVWDYEDNKAELNPGAVPGMPDLALVSSWGWITGFLPPQPPAVGPGEEDDSGSGGGGGDDPNPPVQNSAYAHTPW